MLKLLLICAFIALASAAMPLEDDRIFIERHNDLPAPEEWSWFSSAPATHELRFIVMLKQRNLDELDRIFWAVSDPKSEQYGKHLTLDELADLIAPDDVAIRTVQGWLLSAGVTRFDRMPKTRDAITFYASVDIAERLFACEFWTFQNVKTEKTIVRSYGPYSVPASVERYITVVTGITGFPLPAKEVSIKPANPEVGPEDLRNTYNVSDGAVGIAKNNSQAVAEFQEQYLSPNDLSTFFNEYVPFPAVDTVTKIEGSNNANRPGVEAMLDIEYIMGVAPNVTSWFWEVPSFDFWSDLTEWMNEISSMDEVPFVHSVSYGDQGYTSQPSTTYKDQLNTQFQKAGVRGLSIVFASGDSGAGCYLCSHLQPSFPATSPYVTSVGATRYENGVGTTEMATESFGSGGGFSYYFDTPVYQSEAVNDWYTAATKAGTLPPSDDWNPKGRGTPDVSALGIGFKVVIDGRTEGVGGTSASAPTFSAIVSLLNDVRMQNGNSSLGFLNQWIYQTFAADPMAFTDITDGDNKHSCCDGFQCAAGWDPVSGVGTPNYGVLLNYI